MLPLISSWYDPQPRGWGPCVGSCGPSQYSLQVVRGSQVGPCLHTQLTTAILNQVPHEAASERWPWSWGAGYSHFTPRSLNEDPGMHVALFEQERLDSAQRKRKVRLYFLTQILCLFPGNCSWFAIDVTAAQLLQIAS